MTKYFTNTKEVKEFIKTNKNTYFVNSLLIQTLNKIAKFWKIHRGELTLIITTNKKGKEQVLNVSFSCWDWVTKVTGLQYSHVFGFTPQNEFVERTLSNNI